jgi:hypothetical protein
MGKVRLAERRAGLDVPHYCIFNSGHGRTLWRYYTFCVVMFSYVSKNELELKILGYVLLAEPSASKAMSFVFLGLEIMRTTRLDRRTNFDTSNMFPIRDTIYCSSRHH